MDELVVIEAPRPSIPAKWDFMTADKNFDKYIKNWRRLTIDVVSELWVFYQKLKVQGKRTDLSTNVEKLPTWIEWLDNKGIAAPTPLRHFKALGWLPGDSLVGKMTGNAENYTPAAIIDKVKTVLGRIDLDPASCEMAQQVVKAKRYYTTDDDGLNKPWKGRVFLNPPYGMPFIRDFTDKLIDELPSIDAAILLTNDQTDTLWWQKSAANASLICLPQGRLHFTTPDGKETSPTNGQTFFYFGASENQFLKVFSGSGLIVKVLK